MCTRKCGCIQRKRRTLGFAGRIQVLSSRRVWNRLQSRFQSNLMLLERMGNCFGAVRGRERPRSGAIARRSGPRDRAPLAARVSAHSCDAPSAAPRLLRLHMILASMRRRPDSPRGRAECPPRGAVPLKGPWAWTAPRGRHFSWHHASEESEKRSAAYFSAIHFTVWDLTAGFFVS